MISRSHLADVSSAGQDVKLEIQGILTHDGKAWTLDSFADIITVETVSALWSRYKSAARRSAADRSCGY